MGPLQHARGVDRLVVYSLAAGVSGLGSRATGGRVGDLPAGKVWHDRAMTYAG
jgi:hypothetical protein